MLRSGTRLFVILSFLLFSVSIGFAQNLATISTVNGALVDYPENWELQDTEGFDDVVGFYSGSMNVALYIVPSNGLPLDTDDILRFYVADTESSEDDDIGEFGDIDNYEIHDEYDASRAQRVRTDSRLIEVMAYTDVNDYSVLLRGSFRIGAQDFFLPIFDDLMASVRSSDDEVVFTHGSSAQRPLTEGMIGSVLEPLNIGVLNTNFITEDEKYEFEYPDTWNIRTDDNGKIIFIERVDGIATLYAELTLSSANTNSDTMGLIQEMFDEPVDVTQFLLNDLPASRLVLDDSANNVRQLVMATVRDNVQVLIEATIHIDAVDRVEPILRGILYSARENGEPFNLAISGEAVRTGLLSGEIYGTASVAPQDIVVDGIVLDSVFVTRTGRFIFNYPSEWYEDFINGYIVISNDDDIELYDPSRNDAQLIFLFFEDTGFLEDDYSARGIVLDLIENEPDNVWSDIVEFESVGRSAAYVDLEIFASDTIFRFYYVKLDEIDNIFVRVEFVVDEDDLDEYEPIALAILDTIRFQD